MEATALVITLLVSVMILLCAHPQNAAAAFLEVIPKRLQFFEYEAVTFYCEGVFNCQVVKESKVKIPCSPTSTGSSCTIKNVYHEDSGEYWCDAGGGRRSNSVHITVTAGSVILDSPALPVMEGQTVSLRCRNKTTSSPLPANFHKDGLFISNSFAGNMIINSVSKSDEGLYKCNISATGVSPASWLTVREATSSDTSTIPWIVVTVLLSLLLLAVGVFHMAKAYWHRVALYLSTLTPGSGSAEGPTVSVGSSAPEVSSATYTVVTKSRRKKVEDELSSGPLYYTLDLDDNQQRVDPGISSNTVIPAPSASPSQFLEDPFYSTVQ